MISVIIPAYNCEKTIRRSINSILKQTYEDFEILVINDGSTDSTKKVIENIMKHDSRIVMISQENSGVSKARNVGLSSAKGEYICFVDSDDFVSKTYLEELLSRYEERVLPVVNFGYNSSTSGKLMITNDLILELNHKLLIQDYLVGDLGKMILFSVWNKLFSKSLLEEQKIYFSEELTIGEDMFFVFKYLRHCNKINICSRVLYHYVVIEDSAVHNENRDLAPEYEKLYILFNEFIKKNKICSVDVLGQWCIDILPYVLVKKTIINKSYHDFKIYLENLKKMQFVCCIYKNAGCCGKKKQVLQFLIRLKSPIPIFLMLKSYNLYYKLIYRMKIKNE